MEGSRLQMIEKRLEMRNVLHDRLSDEREFARYAVARKDLGALAGDLDETRIRSVGTSQDERRDRVA